MFGFDKMFDFNRDGKLDSWERAAQFQFMDEMMKDDEKSIFDDDDALQRLYLCYTWVDIE